jgi:hypothetical protein
MITVSFHKELYDGQAVDEATKIYARFAAFEQAEEGERWVLRVTAHKPEREERIARELSNYALGLTINRRTQKTGETP